MNIRKRLDLLKFFSKLTDQSHSNGLSSRKCSIKAPTHLGLCTYYVPMSQQYDINLDTADIEHYSQYNFDKIPIPGTVRSYLEFNTIFSGVFMGWELCKIIFDILFCVLSPPGKRSFVSVV